LPDLIRQSETLEEPPNEWMNWETINPQWWVPCGYAAVRVDSRGTGKSPGQYDPWSLAEAIDFYDAIEWATAQPWCNGNIGLLGISYFAINQWFVANLHPPSLKAIIPWEGFADLYRDALFHGGILSLFMTNWYTAHMLHHLLAVLRESSPTVGTSTRCISGCVIISTAARFAARRRNGTRSMCRCSASAIGPAWACICAAIPRRSCARQARTRSCAFISARMCIRSTLKTHDAIRFASSIIGSRALTTVS
jgi:hypothetical protein